MEEIKQILKGLIDQRGVGYLENNAYAVYKELKSQKTDPSMARIVLIALLAGVSEKAKEMDGSGISKYIQKECCLKKSAADKLAVLFVSLFEKKNMEEWAERDGEGFREFCRKKWEFTWDGEATWYSGGVHIDCYCSVTAEFEVSDKDVVRKTMEKQLKSNPFTSAKKIYQYYKKRLGDMLEEDLEEYVTCDDYYPPVMEDYYGEDVLEKFCREQGFKLVSFTCDGDMSDFESNDDRW